ncbi:MAG: serine/threonine-protein kinase, partial [Deltaproteobacteria bacterium]
MVDRGRAPRTGELLSGRYRLKSLLGSGGMGNVYAAECLVLGRDVAVKILREEHARDPRAVARFLREARAAAKVKHAGVVEIIDAGTDAQGLPYIAQELLSGEDLGEHLERHGGRLGIEESLALMRPVVDAMAAAHARGVIHRDLKPENVFLARDGEGGLLPTIVDFGISKILDEIEGDERTQTGVIVGTPHYMAPEQIVGSREIDGRADVWALGVMLFELMSGELPFGSQSDARIFVRIALGEPTPIESLVPGVPKDLVLVLQRCLRRNIGERYPSAAELARDLRLLRDGRPIDPTLQLAALSPSVPPPPISPASPRDSRGPGANAASAVRAPSIRP